MQWFIIAQRWCLQCVWLAAIALASSNLPLNADNTVSAVVGSSSVETVAANSDLPLSKLWPMPRADFGATGATTSPLPSEIEVKWETETPEAIETSLVSDGKRVYYTDVMGSVGALNFETGEKIWRQDFDTGFVAAASLYLPLMLAESPVALPVLSEEGPVAIEQMKPGELLNQPELPLSKPLLVVGDVEGNVYGMNPATGESIWKSETEGEINAAPTFFLWQDDGETKHYELRVLQTSQDGSLYCFSAQNGEMRWKYESGDQIRCGASIAGAKTYLGGCDGGLHIVDLTTGKASREKLPLGGPTGSTPAIRADTVYVPIMDGVLYAFSAETGEVNWQYEDEDLVQDYRSDVAVDETTLVLTSRTKTVDAIDRRTGERRWRMTLRRRADASPLIVGQDVFIAGSDGRLLRLSLDKGEELWEFETRGAFYASPSVVAGQLLIADDEGVIRCFAAK